MMYFSFDFENGIEFHDTLDEAKKRAEGALNDSRDYADDGWPEEIEQICYGKVAGKCVETMRRAVDKEKDPPSWDFSEVIDYEVQELKLSAEDRAAELMNIPTNQLPKLAVEFAGFMQNWLGICSEVCLFSFCVYAEIVEGCIPKDESRVKYEHRDWFHGKV